MVSLDYFMATDKLMQDSWFIFLLVLGSFASCFIGEGWACVSRDFTVPYSDIPLVL